MVVTITATPDAARMAVDLVIDAGAPGATLVSLVRSDANRHDDVRLPVLPATFEVITVADYEVALTGLVEYEAVVTVAGVDSTVSATVDLGAVLHPHTWVLHPAVVPEDAVQVTFVDWNMPRTTRSTQNAVLGRPDPIVNRDVLGMRAGTLEVHCASYDEVRAIEAAGEQRDTLMLRQNDFPGLDGYFEVDAVTPRIYRETARPGSVQWWVTLTLTEVTRPSGPLLAAAGWTYGTLLDHAGTYRVARGEFETYRDMLVGPVA